MSEHFLTPQAGEPAHAKARRSAPHRSVAGGDPQLVCLGWKTLGAVVKDELGGHLERVSNVPLWVLKQTVAMEKFSLTLLPHVDSISNHMEKHSCGLSKTG